MFATTKEKFQKVLLDLKKRREEKKILASKTFDCLLEIRCPKGQGESASKKIETFILGQGFKVLNHTTEFDTSNPDFDLVLFGIPCNYKQYAKLVKVTSIFRKVSKSIVESKIIKKSFKHLANTSDDWNRVREMIGGETSMRLVLRGEVESEDVQEQV